MLALFRLERPRVYAVFAYTYSVPWFTSPLFLATILFSGRCIILPAAPARQLGPSSRPIRGPSTWEVIFLVLGEQHRRTSPERVAHPTRLTIPERVYTGIFIGGAIGSGKTSACLYPYVEQLLATHAADPQRKAGGLVLDVKRDFCRQVPDIFTRHGPGDHHIEIGLDSPSHNPLHNDLEAYALAYGIATLMTNLFGRGKEPLWQQASTNLVKFVILLHETLDGYVPLFQVYEHVINPAKLRALIEEGEEYLRAHPLRIVKKSVHLSTTGRKERSWHREEGSERIWTDWSSDLVDARRAAGIPRRLDEATPPTKRAENVAQFEAVKRWFEDDQIRIEPKLRTSIVDGISVSWSLCPS